MKQDLPDHHILYKALVEKDAAFESGYDSLSGFSDSFKQKLGFSPGLSADKEVITVTRIPTLLGPMLAGASSKGICLLEFVDRRMLETNIKKLKKLLNAEMNTGNHELFDQLHTELTEYFEGKRKNFDIPLDVPGTDFQKRVWKILMDIPYGQTRSYGKQAEILGNPKAVRAVARANGENRIALIIPCHRVIGKDGKLIGYAGGLWRKEHLLDLERRNKQHDINL